MPVRLETEEAQRILTRRFDSYQHSAYFLFFLRTPFSWSPITRWDPPSIEDEIGKLIEKPAKIHPTAQQPKPCWKV
jgi:hypothetical protein